MEILLNKDNWRFIIDSLSAAGFKCEDKTNYKDLEKMFIDQDFKTLIFVATSDSTNEFYLYSKFIHEEDVYNRTEPRKSNREFVKFILS